MEGNSEPKIKPRLSTVNFDSPATRYVVVDGVCLHRSPELAKGIKLDTVQKQKGKGWRLEESVRETDEAEN